MRGASVPTHLRPPLADRVGTDPPSLPSLCAGEKLRQRCDPTASNTPRPVLIRRGRGPLGALQNLGVSVYEPNTPRSASTISPCVQSARAQSTSGSTRFASVVA